MHEMLLEAFREGKRFIAATIGGHPVIYFDTEKCGSNVYCADCASKPENSALIDGYSVLYDGSTDVCDACGKEITDVHAR